MTPGSEWTRKVEISTSLGLWNGFVPMRVVEWVSTDASFASRRAVDAGDLGAYAAHSGQDVRWGFPDETPPNSPNFHVNFNQSGTSANRIDAADLSVLVADLGIKSCGLSPKAGDDDAATILRWFGIEATGETILIGPNGETGPGYAVVDQAQFERAAQDPYGYRTNTAGAATVIPWSHAKGLYR